MVLTEGRKRLQISPESAVMGTGFALVIVGGAAILNGALMEGGPLLIAGLSCLGVQWRMPAQG
jgi:hypothetical protein